MRSIPKYTKDYDNQSPYAKEPRERSTVNTALFGPGGGKKPKCELCKQTLVTPAGQTYFQCPSCGKITNPEALKQDNKTLTDPTATNTTGLIISQVRKKRRPDPLDEQNGIDDETIEDLRNSGIDPASFKDYL